MTDDTDLSDEAIKERMAFAQRAFDRHENDVNLAISHAVGFGVEAIRTCALINGGAFAATLAFCGAVFRDQPELAKSLSGAAIWFALGVLAAGVASGFAYFSQSAFAYGTAAVTLSWEPPHVRSRTAGKAWDRAGVVCQLIAIAAVIAAYCALLGGAWRFNQVLSL